MNRLITGRVLDGQFFDSKLAKGAIESVLRIIEIEPKIQNPSLVEL